MKFCAKCGQQKELNAFYRNRHNKDGLQAYCKDCQKEYVDQNKEKTKSYQLEWQQKNKNRVSARQQKRRSEKREQVILESVRYRARKNNVPFNLEIDDILIPDFCPILGIKISVESGKGRTDSSPSIDRIDPELGYVKGNIAIVSDRANTIKSFGTAEEHLKVYMWLKKQQNLDTTPTSVV